MAIKQTTKKPTQQTTDEQILVVKRTDIFGAFCPWDGLKEENLSYYHEIIQNKKEFLPRSLMETDPSYKQIIPYVVFTFNDRYFLMQRQAKASEQRLKNKFSLGIGGHIRQEDMTTASIFDWANREFHEEVNYNDMIEIQTIGVLNDDSNPVGQVHLGLVLLITGSSPDIAIKSELKSGQLLSLQELEPFYDRMETWSQMVCDFLKVRHLSP